LSNSALFGHLPFLLHYEMLIALLPAVPRGRIPLQHFPAFLNQIRQSPPRIQRDYTSHSDEETLQAGRRFPGRCRWGFPLAESRRLGRKTVSVRFGGSLEDFICEEAASPIGLAIRLKFS
jgi:hypothetical protein